MKYMTRFAAGLVLASAFSSASANIIVNGGFENGLSGWSCIGADSCTTGTGGNPGMTMRGFDNTGYASLSQNVATVSGNTYQLSFLSKATSLPGNEIGYSFNGFGSVVWVPVTLSYAQSVASFTAIGNSTKLEFFLATNPGTGNFLIDTVSVVQTAAAVPEPGSLALLGLGLAGFAAVRRKRRV